MKAGIGLKQSSGLRVGFFSSGSGRRKQLIWPPRSAGVFSCVAGNRNSELALLNLWNMEL